MEEHRWWWKDALHRQQTGRGMTLSCDSYVVADLDGATLHQVLPQPSPSTYTAQPKPDSLDEDEVIQPRGQRHLRIPPHRHDDILVHEREVTRAA